MCKNCHEPQDQGDGQIDLIDGLCDCCREHQERMTLLTYDIDFDYSMNH